MEDLYSCFFSWNKTPPWYSGSRISPNCCCSPPSCSPLFKRENSAYFQLAQTDFPTKTPFNSHDSCCSVLNHVALHDGPACGDCHGCSAVIEQPIWKTLKAEIPCPRSSMGTDPNWSNRDMHETPTPTHHLGLVVLGNICYLKANATCHMGQSNSQNCRTW